MMSLVVYMKNSITTHEVKYIKEVICQTWEAVFHRDIQTPRTELKIYQAHFDEIRGFRLDTVPSVWYIFSIETKTKE